MLRYEIDARVEAFSTMIGDRLDFDVILPEHQAHGTRSAILGRKMRDGIEGMGDGNEGKREGKKDGIEGVDALITQAAGVRIGVKTADCVPLLGYDASNDSVVAIHSGWKGTIQNIVQVTLERMRQEIQSDPGRMRFVIGPCIHLEAFEVGDDLYQQFAEAGYGDYCKRLPRFGEDHHEKWHIDLPGICECQLREMGVSAIQPSPVCTYAQYQSFYSARRLGPNFKDQRIQNCIMLKK